MGRSIPHPGTTGQWKYGLLECGTLFSPLVGDLSQCTGCLSSPPSGFEDSETQAGEAALLLGGMEAALLLGGMEAAPLLGGMEGQLLCLPRSPVGWSFTPCSGKVGGEM